MCNMSENYSSQGILKKHILAVHDGIKPFKCEICCSQFAFNAGLRIICDAKFTRKADLKIHIDAVHEKKKKHTCVMIVIQDLQERQTCKCLFHQFTRGKGHISVPCAVLILLESKN